MLQIKNLSIIHKKDLCVILNDFSCVLNDGDKAVIIGEEGNGKSTLLKWIYDEKLVDDYCETEGELVKTKERIAYLPQELPKEKRTLSVCEFLWKRRAFWSRHQKRWGRVKDMICPKLINYSENRRLLETIPHRKFCDLAVVYYAIVDISETGVASILIHNAHLDLWDKSETDLYELSLDNYRRIFSITSQNLGDIVLKLMDCKDANSFDKDTLVPMIVVTNKMKMNGAAAILFTDKLREIADSLDSDLYILPSSVHEIIIIATDNAMTVEELKETVCYVNRNELRQEEILSDNVYRFCRSDGNVEII